MTDNEIQEFMGRLDDLTLEDFNAAFKGIYFELNERIRYQSEKHEIDIEGDEIQFILEHGF